VESFGSPAPLQKASMNARAFRQDSGRD